MYSTPMANSYSQPMTSEVAVLPPKPEPFMYITPGKFMVSMAIAYLGIVGCYMFSLGYAEITKGMVESGSLNTCSWSTWMQVLSIVAPATCILRIFLAPAAWLFMGERRNLPAACMNPFALLWMVCYWVPLLMLVCMLAYPGFRDIFSSADTIDRWPSDCEVKRPYHGLFQSNSWALFGAYVYEGFIHLTITFRVNDQEGRTTAFGWPILLATSAFLAFGPIRFLANYEGEPCADMWIEYTFLAVTVFFAFFKLLLSWAQFGMQDAVQSVNSFFGPYAYWSTIIWLLLAASHIIVLETILAYATVIKSGPPYEACGADYKEFWFPRHRGLVYYLYGEFVAFNFWILGMWLWPRVWQPAY